MVDAILDLDSNLNVDQLSNVDVVVQFLLVEVAVYQLFDVRLFLAFDPVDVLAMPGFDVC